MHNISRRHLIPIGAVIAVVLALVLAIAAFSQGPDEETENRTQPAGVRPANLADPPPEGFQTLYIFTGLTNDDTGSDRIATIFHCTNFAPSINPIEVQLFDVTATDVYTSRVNINSGRTWTFATQNLPIYTVDTIISAELIQSGSGRILAEESDVLCVAQVVDPVNAIPSFMTDVPLIDVRVRQLFLPYQSQ